jgi:hypothetical protein
MAYRYDTGTISVANGSKTVTGTLTNFLSAVRRGDDLNAGGNAPVEIDGDPDNDSVTDNTHFELVEPWPYTTLTDAPYSISKGPAWNDVTRLAIEVSTALANSTEILSGIGVPDDSIGSDGSAYFRQDEPELYFKSSGSWGSPISLTGPQGPAGANNITSSTTSRTLNTGSMAFTVDAGKAIQSGMRMRVSNSSSNYMEGVVSSYTGTSLTITMDRFVGSGTFAVWAIAPVGDKGDKGDTGASYVGTSTTSLAIGTGSKSITTQAGLAYVVGSPIRLASNANIANFMEGSVASYSGTSMTVTVAAVGGSGTFADWNLSLSGRQGATGATGNPGPANSLSIGTVTTGDPGSSADATITGTAPSQTLNLTIPKGDPGTDGTDGTDGIDGSILTATSSSSVTSATGAKSFTLNADANFLVNQRLRIASSSNANNWMSGLVSSIDHDTLALGVTVDLIGSDPQSALDWTISITGEKGDPGPSGGFGSLTATKGNIPSADGTTYGAVQIGPNGTVPIADSTQTYGWDWKAEDAINAGPYWTSSDVASAATCDIGAAVTPFVRITGTTTITSLGTGASKFRFVEFTGTLNLIYNGTSLILPGAANIMTQAGDKGIFVSDGSGNWKCVAWTPIAFLPREKLTGTRTYYVRSDGSDSNTGRANTSGGAFLTIQKALDVVYGTLDLGGFNVTIQVQDGTWTQALNVSSPQVGAGSIILQGNLTTPANCLISTGASNCITVYGSGTVLTVRGFKFTTTGANHFQATFNGLILFGTVNFGSAGTQYHMRADNAGQIGLYPGDTYTITGGGAAHCLVLSFGSIAISSITVTLTGTPAWSNSFANIQGGALSIYNTTWSGSATGSRYAVLANGLLNSFGQGTSTSYFPGNSPGTTASGGVQI